LVIAIINDLETDNFLGVIGYTNDNIGFLSNNAELNEVLNVITDYDYLTIDIEEHLNNQTLILSKKVTLKDDMYIYGIMEYLPKKYYIKEYREISGDLSEELKNSFRRGQI
jgi:TusA-related sulfurtransferase